MTGDGVREEDGGMRAVRATPKSNSVDNVRALQGDATVLEDAIKL